MRSKRDAKAEAAFGALAGLREGDDGDEVRHRVGEAQDPTLVVVFGRCWTWKRSHVDRVAEAEVVCFDCEDVCEVRLELELDVQLEVAGAEVAHDEVLLEPDRDPPPANDLQFVPLEAPRQRVAAEVGGLVWIAPSSCQQLRPGTVDEHDEARQEARVVGEQAGWGTSMSPRSSAMQNVDPARMVFGTARELTPWPRGCAGLARPVCIRSKRLFYSAAGNLWNRFHRLQLFIRRGT